MKRLHGKGLSTTTKRAEPITSDDEFLLWQSGQFGTYSSQALLNTVYYYNSKVFGLRSFDEHRNLRCAQFNKKVDKKSTLAVSGIKTMKVDNIIVHHYEI